MIQARLHKKNVHKIIRVAIYVLCILPFLISLWLPSTSSANGENEVVYIVPVENEIERGLQAFMERAFQEAEEAKADHIVIEINTFGGAVVAADGIGQLLQETTTPVSAFIDGKAISAGAYIALNADGIYMVPGSTMGAATVIDQSGKMADKKSLSYWKRAMIAAAETNGRDPLYAKAMVDPEVEIEGLTPKGEPLTFSASQALEHGYAEKVFQTRAEVLQHLELEKATVVEVESTFSEKIARFVTHPMIVPFLFSLGSLGLIVELYSPGFGIPGSIGLIALFLFFFGHMIAGFAGWESLILFGIGIALLAIEIFIIPGFGLFGVLGIGSVAGSLALASFDIVTGLKSLGIALLITIVGAAILAKFLNKRGVWSKLVLHEELSNTEGTNAFQQKSELVGKTGVTVTKLRPSGTVVIEEKRLDVVAEGGFIDNNIPVKVISVEGTRIVVREI